MTTTLRIVKPTPTFDVDRFLRSGGAGTRIALYQPGDIVFSQGDASDSVMYLQHGTVKLSVLSGSGQEAVIAMPETRKLGYIEYRDGLKVNDSLVTVILRDARVVRRASQTG
jgi:CRP-like cAMP-binding protein